VLASKATIYELVFPFSSILLEFFIHGKLLSVGQWFGILVVLFAVYKVVKIKKEKIISI
jgi:drug/metabolite transporter (DMT)-like permease